MTEADLTNCLMPPSERPLPRMVRGRGSHLWDEHGRRYFDAVQGWAVNCLGHSPAELRAALGEQAAAVINVGPAYHNQPALDLARKLVEASGLSRVFLASSGAEANEGAVKLARKWGQQHLGGAFEIITTQDGFHGRTLAMSHATGKPGFAAAFGPAIAGFPKAPFGDVSAVEKRIGPATAAVMVEPIQGEAGVVLPPPGYLRDLRALCDARGVLLIADEVQTGMARTGPLFAHQADGVSPDILTLGKGLGGGLPVSAVLANERAACFARGDHGGTFSGNALVCAGANAIFDALVEPSNAATRERSARLLEQALRSIARAHAAELRGRGHLWALVLQTQRASAVQTRAFTQGLLLNAPRPNVLRLMPALNLSEQDVSELATLLDGALSSAGSLPAM